MTQVVFLLSVLFFAMAQIIIRSNAGQNNEMYFTLISFVLGIALPNPKLTGIPSTAYHPKLDKARIITQNEQVLQGNQARTGTVL